jgi:hypothetical protein
MSLKLTQDILTNLEGRHTINTRRSKEYLPSPQQATLEPYPSSEGSFNVCLSHPPIIYIIHE